MTRATSEQADALHALVATSLTAEIERYRAAGEPLPPALLAQAIKFLKDNEVTAPASTSKRLDRLANALPSMDDLDNVISFPQR